jgi:hypothetical protein
MGDDAEVADVRLAHVAEKINPMAIGYQLSVVGP